MRVTNVWETVEKNKDDPRARAFMPMAQESDLMLVLNWHEPGYRFEFHHHCGTSQSYLVLKGGITIRTQKSVDAPVQESKLKTGDCIMIEAGEYYELENEGNEPVILYQAKQPATQIQVLGREPVDETVFFADYL